MSLVNHVLFPVDFSEQSVAIAPAVAAYARHFDARLTVLHAYEWPPEGIEEDWSGEATKQLEARFRARLATFLRDDLPVEAERVVVRGKAGHTIATEAKARGVDLIMMPTRGNTPFRQLLLGSTTASVLHDAECAVWTSAHAEVMPIPRECRRIVCGIDLREPSVTVMEAARLMAESWNASLAIVHGVVAVDPRFETAIADRAHEWLKNDARERYPNLAQRAGISQELEIVEELRVGLGLADAARRHEADLMVIGRGVIQGALGRLRSHAHEIIRLSPCPVLSV